LSFPEEEPENALASIRQERERCRLRDLLLAGAASAPIGVADEAYFERLRDRARRHRRG
jgi:hypothetical protein